MITVSNHNQRITEVDLSTAPEAIKKGKDFFEKAASMYGNSDTIKKTIDLYISKLNEFAAQKQQAKESAKPTPKKSVKSVAKKPTQINTDSTEKKKTVRKKSEKSVQSVASKKSARKKVQRKSAAKKPITTSTNNRPAKAPVTVKKLSLELQVIKSFAGMNGKTYSAVVFKNKHKQISNYLNDDKIHDHKAIILEIKSKLNKVITSLDEHTATNATINIDKEFEAKCRQIVKSGTVRLRTEFIAGIKPRKTRAVKK